MKKLFYFWILGVIGSEVTTTSATATTTAGTAGTEKLTTTDVYDATTAELNVTSPVQTTGALTKLKTFTGTLNKKAICVITGDLFRSAYTETA